MTKQQYHHRSPESRNVGKGIRKNIYDVYLPTENNKEEYVQDIRARDVEQARQRLSPGSKLENETDAKYKQRVEESKRYIIRKAKDENYLESEHYDD